MKSFQNKHSQIVLFFRIAKFQERLFAHTEVVTTRKFSVISLKRETWSNFDERRRFIFFKRVGGIEVNVNSDYS